MESLTVTCPPKALSEIFKSNPNPKVTKIKSPHREFIYALFHNMIILGCEDGTLAFFEKKSGEKIREFKAHKGKIFALKIVGNTLLSASNHIIKIWNLDTKDFCEECEKSYKPVKEHEIFTSAYFDGEHIVTNTMIFNHPDDHVHNVHTKSRIRFWHMNSTEKPKTLKGHTRQFSFFENFAIFRADDERTLYVYELNENRIVNGRNVEHFYGNPKDWTIYKNQLWIVKGGEKKKLSVYSLPNFTRIQKKEIVFPDENVIFYRNDVYFYQNMVSFKDGKNCLILALNNKELIEVGKFRLVEDIKFSLKHFGSSILFMNEKELGVLENGKYTSLLDWNYRSQTKVKIENDTLYFIGREGVLNLVDYSQKSENKE